MNIYHYTSSQGLLEILKNKSLRFTDSQHLNDPNELKAYLDIAKEVIKNEFSDYIDVFFYDFINEKNLFETDGIQFKCWLSKFVSLPTRYYILSFSKSKDYLPLWNMYGEGGYSITFDYDSFISNYETRFKNDGIPFYNDDVIYSKKEAYDYLKKEINEIIKRFDNEKYDNDEEKDEIKSNYESEIFKVIDRLRFFFKFDSYEYENEYRILIECTVINKKIKIVDDELNICELSNDQYASNFSVKNGYIRNHIDVIDENFYDYIEEISVSPYLNGIIAKETLENVLESIGLKKTKVLSSAIEIRW